jgi:ABC-2 type transport system ATP-binding protein
VSCTGRATFLACSSAGKTDNQRLLLFLNCPSSGDGMVSPPLLTPPSPSRILPGVTPAPTDSLAIDLHNVTKVYGRKVHALRGINMQVRRGEVFGLLGPNGAGKSTLVKIMMTVIRATRAEGTVLGDPVGRKSTLRKVGYLPENHRFPRYLSGRQTVEFFGALAGVDRRSRKRRAAELLDLVGMTDAADRKIATYSKGMAQRTGLAQALVNDPDLVVLDEPTDGVDPGGRRDIRIVLEKMRDEGKTVFVNSHLLSELEVISDRVAILVGGQVALQGTIDELTVAKQRYEFDLSDSSGIPLISILFRTLPGVFQLPPPPPPGGPPPLLPPVLKGTLPTGEWAELLGRQTLRVGITEPAAVQSLLDSFRREGLIVRRMQLVRPSLEDLFVETVGANGDAGGGGRGAR